MMEHLKLIKIYKRKVKLRKLYPVILTIIVIVITMVMGINRIKSPLDLIVYILKK
jgi:uncharacterized protein YybS (DUF2232 family)